ncbi:ketopantoate reductase family protein [Euzebya rosea]|uniref:ketopantoate reductase family protein n=1 Tax=Euzebya rosea TaxID=2052804 RepID=UPI000D3EB91E|nr:2-dehydropantoate 2-reductase N-terminal domain-containing protein [Euzebya rosea]
MTTSTDIRTVVVGAGAIGGALAVGLAESGQEVSVVARGAHLDAIRSGGLTREAPDGSTTVTIEAHGHVSDTTIGEDTVVVLATKAHQVEPVLDDLLAHGGPDVPVACMHNGIEGERLALRRFRRVQGVLINVPGVHLEPGIVRVHANEPRGVLDVGRYLSGRDDLSVRLAASWTAAGFLSEATDDIVARKWAKLLGNVGNALQVLCGTERESFDELYGVVRAEAEAVLAAAGIVPDLEVQHRRAAMVARADIGADRRPGGSTWQSAVRGHSDSEVTMLNGEIVLTGRLHGIPTPANDLVQAETLRLLRDGDPVGSRDQAALLRRLG